MTKHFLHPTYFPNIANFKAMLMAETLCFEVCDNYQKQSYRNRAEIYSANGKLALTVPVNYTQKNRQLYKDVKISNSENWQLLHLKSLQSAYSMSPFFEYYIDDLLPLFQKKYRFILDLNFKVFETLLDCLQTEIAFTKTETFHIEINYETNNETHTSDFRYLVNKQKSYIEFQSYAQVFSLKHGFISNLSILDLLFNEGTNSLLYLKKQEIV